MPTTLLCWSEAGEATARPLGELMDIADDEPSAAPPTPAAQPSAGPPAPVFSQSCPPPPQLAPTPAAGDGAPPLHGGGASASDVAALSAGGAGLLFNSVVTFATSVLQQSPAYLQHPR